MLAIFDEAGILDKKESELEFPGDSSFLGFLSLWACKGRFLCLLAMLYSGHYK